MNFETYLIESASEVFLHVLLNTQSKRTHRGGGKEMAADVGGTWNSFYSAKNRGMNAVHVIAIAKEKSEEALASLNKAADVNDVQITHSKTAVF